MLAGFPFAYEVDFSTGLPTGAVVYSLLGNDGQPVLNFNSLTVVPPVGAVSIVLTIPGTANTCSKPLFERRTLVWSYPTSTGVVNGRIDYRVEKDMPFPATFYGVRAKLGVEPQELEDESIDLLLAYATVVGDSDVSAYATSGDLNTLLVVNAIEAQAALHALPSLQLAVARMEDSGTNQFQRFASIDWDGLANSLGQYVSNFQTLVGTDVTFVPLLVVAGQNIDPVTAAEYPA